MNLPLQHVYGWNGAFWNSTTKYTNTEIVKFPTTTVNGYLASKSLWHFGSFAYINLTPQNKSQITSHLFCTRPTTTLRRNVPTAALQHLSALVAAFGLDITWNTNGEIIIIVIAHALCDPAAMRAFFGVH